MGKQMFLIVVLTLIISVPSLFAQGVFLERGENAFHTGLGFFVNGESPGFFVRGGYTFAGILDGEVQWYKGKRGTMFSSILVPRVTYYPVKEMDTPSSPTVGVSLQYNQFTVREVTTAIIPIQQPVVGYITQQIVNDVTYHYIFGTGSVHRTFGVWNNYSMRPFVECGFGVSNKGWKFLWKLGTTLSKQTQRNTLFVLAPSIQHEPHTTTVLITAGFVFL